MARPDVATTPQSRSEFRTRSISESIARVGALHCRRRTPSELDRLEPCLSSSRQAKRDRSFATRNSSPEVDSRDSELADTRTLGRIAKYTNCSKDASLGGSAKPLASEGAACVQGKCATATSKGDDKGAAAIEGATASSYGKDRGRAAKMEAASMPTLRRSDDPEGSASRRNVPRVHAVARVLGVTKTIRAGILLTASVHGVLMAGASWLDIVVARQWSQVCDYGHVDFGEVCCTFDSPMSAAANASGFSTMRLGLWNGDSDPQRTLCIVHLTDLAKRWGVSEQDALLLGQAVEQAGTEVTFINNILRVYKKQYIPLCKRRKLDLLNIDNLHLKQFLYTSSFFEFQVLPSLHAPWQLLLRHQLPPYPLDQPLCVSSVVYNRTDLRSRHERRQAEKNRREGRDKGHAESWHRTLTIFPSTCIGTLTFRSLKLSATLLSRSRIQRKRQQSML
jgi:hypothetical protein